MNEQDLKEIIENINYAKEQKGCYENTYSYFKVSAIENLVKTEEDIRLDQTKKVFEALSFIINHGSCSYRYLIYDMLNFKAENYIELIKGLDITNAIVELQGLREENKRLKEILKEDK